MVHFNFVFEDNTPQNVIQAVEAAGDRWASHLQDDVTVNIAVQTGSFPIDNVIGFAYPSLVRAEYTDVLNQFEQDQTSAIDQEAIDYLPSLQARNGGIRRLINRTETSFWHHRDTSVSNIWLTRANAKALNVIDTDHSEFDGLIYFNDSVRWDYEPDDGIELDKYDFVGSAVHEIGHLLGVISGIDVLDFTFQSNASVADEDYDFITPMDLFRQSDRTAGRPLIDWSLSYREKYFSINGGGNRHKSNKSSHSNNSGLERIAPFSNGLSTFGPGGRFQASHWRNDVDGAMKPSLHSGELNLISHLDPQLLDAIGWDIEGESSLTGQPSSIDYSIDDDGFDAYLRRSRRSSGNSSRNFWQVDTEYRSQSIWEEFWQTRGLRSTTANNDTDQDGENALPSLAPLSHDGGSDRSNRTQDYDWVRGSNGSDQVYGNQGHDRLIGLGNADLLWGNSGHDVLIGGRGADRLVGNVGDDLIRGGAGDDVLRGGHGIDILMGGVGADTFVLESKKGYDIVRDFQVEELDRLTLSGTLTREQLSIQQQGHHAIISTDNQILMVVRNVEVGELIAADVIG